MREIRLNIQIPDGALDRFRASAERIREAFSDVAEVVRDSPEVRHSFDGSVPRWVALSANRSLQRYARYETSLAWAAENLSRREVGLAEIPPVRQGGTALFNSQHERRQCELQMMRTTGRLMRSPSYHFRRLGLAAESAQGALERLAAVEIEPIDSPEIFIPRPANAHLNEAGGRIACISHAGDLSEVVESYERLRADSDRRQSVDSDDLDRLFSEIESLTKGFNHENQ